MAHRNAEIYQQAYEAFLKQDAEAAMKLMAPDVRWHEAGAAEPIEGRDAVAARFTMTGDLAADVDVHEMLASDDHVVALITAHMRKPSGEDISYRAVEVVHVEDGRISERWAFMDAVPTDVQEFFAGLG